MQKNIIEHRGDTYVLDTQEKIDMFNEMLELEKHLHKPAKECLNEVIKVSELKSILLYGKKRHIIHINIDNEGNYMKFYDNKDESLNN